MAARSFALDLLELTTGEMNATYKLRLSERDHADMRAHVVTGGIPSRIIVAEFKANGELSFDLTGYIVTRFQFVVLSGTTNLVVGHSLADSDGDSSLQWSNISAPYSIDLNGLCDPNFTSVTTVDVAHVACVVYGYLPADPDSGQ